VSCSSCLDPSPMLGIEPRFIDRPAHRVVTILPVVSPHTKRSGFEVICLSVSAYLALDRFPLNLILMAFIKICHDIPNLVKIEQKCPALNMKTQIRFNVARHYIY
jgi:hypothetical protein